MAGDIFKDAAEVIARLDDPRLRLVDARSVPHGGTVKMPTGKERYAEGHLPGAVHLDYADDLSDPATPYATRVAPPDAFAAALAAAGIGDEHLVVAYDDGDIPFAARIVWMLRYYGHDDAYVLAGGVREWLLAGHPSTDAVPDHPPATFTPRARPAMRAHLEEVQAVVARHADAQLLETQRDATYAQRDRDIAGAVRLSGNLLLDDANGGRVGDHARLHAAVAALGLDPHKRTIVSCGSGVSASGAWVALRDIGFTDVAVYDGSWMEWRHLGLPTVPKAGA